MNVSQDVKVIKTLFDLSSIVDNLLLLLSEKEKYVITKRFNLDNAGKHTLEDIGSKYSVTRERIRQIERNALAKMKRNVFNTALRDLHDFAYNVVHLNGSILREKDLTDSLAKLSQGEISINKNFAHLSFVLHDSVECVGNTINFHPYLRLKNVPDYSLKFASNKVVNQMHKYGDIRPLHRLNTDLADTFKELNFDLTTVRSLISIDKRITLLENDFVGLLEWRHIHPRTLREKILYILKRKAEAMHFTDIADAISKLNFDSRNVNLQAVHNELIRHDNFVLIGRGIYALKDWGYERGTVIEVIEKILTEHSKLSVDEIVDMVLSQRQIKRITILLALKNSEKFERVGRKKYSLKK